MSSAPRLVPTTVSTQVRYPSLHRTLPSVLASRDKKSCPQNICTMKWARRLFDVICVLPEYGLSRAGMRTLSRHAGDIVDSLPNPVIVAELGSGSGQKTRLLLEALAAQTARELLPD